MIYIYNVSFIYIRIIFHVGVISLTSLTDAFVDIKNATVHSFGKPEGEDGLQCYLGLEDAAYDIERRMSIMIDAVDAAYDRSDKDPDVLKIFLAPEFFFRWKVSLSRYLVKSVSDSAYTHY